MNSVAENLPEVKPPSHHQIVSWLDKFAIKRGYFTRLFLAGLC